MATKKKSSSRKSGRRKYGDAELEEFFVNYHSLSGEQYKVLGIKGPGQALKLVKSGLR